MNVPSPSCPYCNALIPPQSLAPSGRVRCPRCGELQPGNAQAGEWSAEWSAEREALRDSRSALHSPPHSAASRNRKVAGIVLAVMAGMALAGLALALGTWKLRESRHPRPIADPHAENSRAPAELSALGYLPADTNLLAGIQVADLLKDKLGAQLLKAPLPGLLNSALTGIEQRTGLALSGIDHVILGTTIKDEVPQLTIVVRTRQPYARENIARRFAPKPLSQHRRPLFRLKLEPTGGGFLWCADPRTVVMILRPDAAKIEDMDRIPAEARKGDDGLPAPVRDVLEKRLRNCVLWAAGSLEQTQVIDTLALVTRLPANEVRLLKGMRVFGLGVRMQEELTISGAIEARDNRAALAWTNYLEAVPWGGARSKKIVGPPAKGPESTWVNLQVRAEPAAVRGLLDNAPVVGARKD